MLRPFQINLELEKEGKKGPLYKLLEEKIKTLIQNGTLKPGDALPSSRELAEQVKISRKTVVNAMESLVISGWLVNRERVGLFVSDSIPGEKKAVVPEVKFDPRRWLEIDDGLPDTSIAPVAELSRAYRQIFNRVSKWKILEVSDPRGFRKFRESISSMLNHERGLQTNYTDICVTRGSQMALFLISNVVLNPGDTIVVENPCYERAYETFQKAHLNVVQIAVDKDGLIVSELEQVLESQQIQAIYLTPRHHYPTMVPMSTSRKERLMALAVKHRFYVIEDDYDYDFSQHGVKEKPMAASLPKENSLYIGTFSKVLSPSIRIGFLAAPETLIDQIGEYRRLIDLQGDNVMEQAVLDLMLSGDLKKHIKKSSIYYEEKKSLFVKVLRLRLGQRIEVVPPKGGLALWVSFHTQKSKEEIQRFLIEKRIKVHVVEDAYGHLGIRIGYATLTEDNINHLADVLRMIL